MMYQLGRVPDRPQIVTEKIKVNEHCLYELDRKKQLNVGSSFVVVHNSHTSECDYKTDSKPTANYIIEQFHRRYDSVET